MRAKRLGRGPDKAVLLDPSLPAVAGGSPIRLPERPLIFGEPAIGEAEIQSVADCLRSHWIGVGSRVESLEAEFARYKGAPFAAAVSSGTAAIQLALLALGIGPDDEIIAPTMTFCSAIHSILHAGATPVLIDCLRNTFNMDARDIAARITPRTKAILVVHMCGRCCEMDSILQLAREHNLLVIEDCAHAIEATDRGTPAGLMGDAGCFSFYATKNITTADGGMVIARSREVFQRIKRLSLHGMTRNAWERHSTGAAGYEVVEPGFKYNMTDMAAALGLPQLQSIEARWRRRETLWRAYNEGLKHLPLELPPSANADSRHAYHLYTPLLIPGALKIDRDMLLAALEAENIGSGIHFVPVHAQPYYRERYQLNDADFPNATHVGTHTFSLPLTAAMSETDVSDVCTALTRIMNYYG